MTETQLQIQGYTLHGLLGRGGMAEVYLATQDSLRRKVAIKVLTTSDDQHFIQRFIQEGHVIAALNHPAIITIYDINQLPDGRYYLVMEYLSGGDLTQYKGQALPAIRVLPIIAQIASGLAVVHGKGLVHRDIKPANILFRDTNNIVITDFGIAKDLHMDSEMTQHGIVVGSPSYSSPEQAQCQPVDPRSDIYSLGVLMIEMLLGYNPYRGESYAQTVLHHTQMPVPALPAHCQALQPVLDKMLAKDPAERYASCQELLAVLSTVSLTDTQAKAVSKVPEPAVAKAPLALPWRAIAAGGVVIVLLAFSFPALHKQWQVRQYLRQAEQQLTQQHLTSPDKANADYFYRQALALQPDNADAKAGLKRVEEARIAQYLHQAEQRFAESKWLEPENDSAWFYWQQAKALAPNQPQVAAGMQRIAAVYRGLAQQAYEDHDLTQALQHVAKGLRADGQNVALLELQQQWLAEQEAANKPKAATSSTEKKATTPKKKAPKKEPSFWQRLFGRH